MATFALIHGAGDVGWYWHLVERELRDRGHEVVAPDLPIDNDAATFSDYAGTGTPPPSSATACQPPILSCCLP